MVQVWCEYSSISDLWKVLLDYEIVDIFWMNSTNANVFVPMSMKASCVEIISPVFGRSGLVVEKDAFGNLVLSTAKTETTDEETSRPIIGKVAKKRE